MRCEACGRTHAPAMSFASLYRPPRLCPECRRRYRPGRHDEAIPIDGGLVRYVYVFAAESADNQLATVLFDALGPLFLEAEGWCREGAAVVLFELAEAATLARWFPAVAAFRDVRLFSLFRRTIGGRTVADPGGFHGNSTRPVYKLHDSLIE